MTQDIIISLDTPTRAFLQITSDDIMNVKMNVLLAILR